MNLFFLGAAIFCVLQFFYGSVFCLFIFLVPVLWTFLLADGLCSSYFEIPEAEHVSVALRSGCSRAKPTAYTGFGTQLKYRYVYLAAFIFWLVSIFWISSPHSAAIIGLIVLSGYLSLYWVLFFISARSAIQLLRIPIMVAAPVCWVGCEFLRNILLGGFSFCSIEHLLSANPVLIQIADIGGGYFVGGMVMSVGTGIGTILLRCPCCKFQRTNSAKSGRGRIFVTIICTFLIITATIFYGYLMISKSNNLPEDGLKLKIAALQGNSPVSITMTNQQLSDCFNQYVELTREAVRNNNGDALDLIIWSETVCPIPYIVFKNGATYESQGWNQRLLEQMTDMLLDLSAEVNSPILYGISTTIADNNKKNKNTNSEISRLNSALLVAPNPPVFKSRYDKIQLVMFGEYVPFADYLPENFPLRSICQEAMRGESPVAIPIKDNVYASVNICFESTVPHHVRGQILSLQKLGQNPVLLINISNCGWFNFTNQIDQHLATHIFRAVENRRPYVTAANCGFSATINCYGQITKIGKRKSAEPVIDQLAVQYWTPLYHSVGDIPAIICTIIMLAFVFYARVATNKSVNRN
jgi:apolipoprotein N-acyltransferase